MADDQREYGQREPHVEVTDHSDWRRRGFHLLCENGWTVSVQFGCGTYSANHFYGLRPGDEWYEISPTAEIAAWNVAGVWHDFGADEVKGYQSAEDVLGWIAFFSTQPSGSEATPPKELR